MSTTMIDTPCPGAGAGRCAPGGAMDIWTMRLRRTGRDRGQRGAARLALPTAAPFAHMTTALDYQ